MMYIWYFCCLVRASMLPALAVTLESSHAYPGKMASPWAHGIHPWIWVNDFVTSPAKCFFFRRVSSSQRGTQKLGNWGGCTSMFLSFRGCQWHITPLIRLKTMFAHYTPFLVERHSSEPSVRNFVKGLNWPQKPIKLFVFLNFQASNVMLRHTH